MGILTDPNNSKRSAIGDLIMNHYLKISWLSYFAGLIFLFVLPHPWYSHKTYFSENALLPGLVTGEFNQQKATKRYYEDLKEENSRYPGQAPFPWLEAQFKQLGLDVYRQEFELGYPLANNTFTGSNVYAILRAPKSASTEALVLSAPHRPPNSPHQSTDAGIAIILAAAKFFRNQIYWAKDVIFLITEHEFLGVQAWLEAYHGVSYGDGSIKPGKLPGRAGSIQAAINLEIETPDITHLNVKVEGLNGQLPNLDLVNLVNRLIMREGLYPMFQGVEDHPRPESYKGYMRSLSTMLSMMSSQSTGVPSGNHGLFHRFGIEAVTLEGVYQKRKGRVKADFHVLGRIVEGVFRSLNNLLERFHQSFFFYLLCSGSRYISIGMYMPMFGLLAISFLISALGIWFTLLAKLNDKKGVEITEVPIPFIVPENFTKTLPIFFIVHFLGLVGYHLPTISTKFGEAFQIGPEDAVPICLGSFSVILLLLPFLSRPNLALPPGTWQVAKCLLNLELAAIAGCCSLINISLTTLLTILYLPLALLVGPQKGFRRICLVMYTLLCHPLILAGLAATIDTVRTFPTVGIEKLTIRSLEAWQRSVMFSIVDSYIYGNVLYDLGTVLVLPCWLVIYLLCFAENTETSQDPIKLKKEVIMVLTADTWLPTEEELTVKEVPLGTPALRAGSFHMGKYCEAQNNEFMLCRDETNDPRACIKEGKEVTSCSYNFFKAVKAAFDACVLENLGIERPDYGYFCLPKIHATDRPAPVETAPAWMNNDKAQKLKELPDDFPRDHRPWGAWGTGSPSFGGSG